MSFIYLLILWTYLVLVHMGVSQTSMHISGPEAWMKSYHSVQVEGRDWCEIGLMAQCLLSFLLICPESEALKTDICNAVLWSLEWKCQWCPVMPTHTVFIVLTHRNRYISKSRNEETRNGTETKHHSPNWPLPYMIWFTIPTIQVDYHQITLLLYTY